MKEKDHIRKSHNVTMLLYHIVLPAKYRRDVFTKEVFETMINVCRDIEKRYEIMFLEIGNDKDHIHFMVQWIPTMSVYRIVTILKSIISVQIMKEHREEIKKKLWWGKLRTSGYYSNTVWAFAGEQTIRNYIRNQGISEYQVQYEKNIKKGIIPLFPASG